MTTHPRDGSQPALAALARILHYPDATLQAHADEMAALLMTRPELPATDRGELERFLRWLGNADLLHLQAQYVETFDRGKQVSLHLFEHVHGESRDRGPAMVELRMAYRERGLDIAASELPDYLPMFLEFCAQIPEAEAREWLEDISHIVQQLHVRLAQRDSRFAVPMRLLLRLIDVEPWPPELLEETAGEARDDSRAALDSVWYEEPVTFEPGSALKAARGQSGGGGGGHNGGASGQR